MCFFCRGEQRVDVLLVANEDWIHTLCGFIVVAASYIFFLWCSWLGFWRDILVFRCFDLLTECFVRLFAIQKLVSCLLWKTFNYRMHQIDFLAWLYHRRDNIYFRLRWCFAGLSVQSIFHRFEIYHRRERYFILLDKAHLYWIFLQGHSRSSFFLNYLVSEPLWRLTLMVMVDSGLL